MLDCAYLSGKTLHQKSFIPVFVTEKSDFAPDYKFFTALLEQDSVANLRYGVLYLLALSSLGVYSIILAG